MRWKLRITSRGWWRVVRYPDGFEFWTGPHKSCYDAVAHYVDGEVRYGPDYA